MLQIIGKGGMARELASYYGNNNIMAEYDEIFYLHPKIDPLLNPGVDKGTYISSAVTLDLPSVGGFFG